MAPDPAHNMTDHGSQTDDYDGCRSATIGYYWDRERHQFVDDVMVRWQDRRGQWHREEFANKAAIPPRLAAIAARTQRHYEPTGWPI